MKNQLTKIVATGVLLGAMSGLAFAETQIDTDTLNIHVAVQPTCTIASVDTIEKVLLPGETYTVRKSGTINCTAQANGIEYSVAAANDPRVLTGPGSATLPFQLYLDNNNSKSETLWGTAYANRIIIEPTLTGEGEWHEVGGTWIHPFYFWFSTTNSGQQSGCYNGQVALTLYSNDDPNCY